MPSRRRRQVELERVLGTPALFATAYGNVGSSIYYALGLTAVFALGLTPLVFVVAGVIFAATAATYAEGTVRYPEAGGSSSFARHAYNELVSFGAAWAQMLVYVVTVADLGVLRSPLPVDLLGAAAREPVGHRRRRDRDRGPGRPEHRRSPGGGAALDHACRDRLRDADPARRARLRARLQPGDPRRQHPLGHRADVVEPRDRGAGGDAGLHRRGNRLEPRRGGA